jgi:hypothetical protein
MEFLILSWRSLVARQMKRAFSGAFWVNWCGVMGFNIDRGRAGRYHELEIGLGG